VFLLNLTHLIIYFPVRSNLCTIIQLKVTSYILAIVLYVSKTKCGIIQTSNSKQLEVFEKIVEERK